MRKAFHDRELEELATDVDDAIGQLHSKATDAKDPDRYAHEIFLACRMLDTCYFTKAFLDGKINCTAQTELCALLEEAMNLMPTHTTWANQIRHWIHDLLMLPTTFAEIESDADPDDWD